MYSKTLFLLLFFLPGTSNLYGWGFLAHKQINKLAVFTLPPEMFGFYKKHLDFIEHNAVNPDKRRSIVKEEACRHYIDLDAYPDSLPFYWQEAIQLFPQDSLLRHGIVPWHIQKIKHQLTKAFRQKDSDRILRLSADLGHYASDANVPLHTTKNYNGQLSGQHGIHGFWESRLPELFHSGYDFFCGKARYLENTQQEAWNCVYQAHAAVDSVLHFEQQLNHMFPDDRKYAFEERNGTTVKVYSEEYSNAYHLLLSGQVERRMQASVLFTGSLWYTCWIDAGQPDLMGLLEYEFSPEEKNALEEEKTAIPTHDHCLH